MSRNWVCIPMRSPSSVPLVRQCSLKRQVVIATQSPTLVDQFEPEDVLVADRVDGRTELKRLDRDRLVKWLEDYTLGQLWEKNEIGGRPVREVSKDASG